MKRTAHTELSKTDLRGRALRRRARRLGLSLCCVVCSSAFAARAEDIGGLELETGSPDALCPDLALTREAVRRRLGELVVPSGSGWRARYTIGHAPEGTPRDFVRLELFAPDGSRALERELPLEGESCSTMAEVIALVLDSHFRTLRVHEPAPATPARAGEAEPTPSPSRPLAAEPAPVTGVASPAAGVTSPPERLGFLGAELGASLARGPTVGGHALLELWPRLYAGGALLLPLLEEKERLPEGGEVSARGLEARVHLGWGPRWGPLRTYLGPGVRLKVQRGKGDGLPRDEAGYRAVWAAGIEAGVLWQLSARATFTFAGTLDAPLTALGGEFNVDDTEVLKPEPLSAWLGIGVGFGF